MGEETAELHATHGYERVYWGGAALALLADVQAHRRDLGTLDAAVRDLYECCAWPPQEREAAPLVGRMDRAFGEPIWASLVERHLSSTSLPELADTYAWLGLERGEDGLLRFVDAPGSAVRDAIMSGSSDR